MNGIINTNHPYNFYIHRSTHELYSVCSVRVHTRTCVTHQVVGVCVCVVTTTHVINLTREMTSLSWTAAF